MSITKLIQELKNNNEDFELYPTSKEMIECLRHRIAGDKEWLDIGCGTCNLKKYLPASIKNYYVIEKSKILLDKLDAETIVLGTDFYATYLLDKPVDYVFCNPPYSDFENWAIQIISNSNCKKIFLVIPTRWRDSEKIKRAIEDSKSKSYIVDSFDFLDAERKARAVVDVVEIERQYSTERYNDNNRQYERIQFNETAFSQFLNEFFKIEKEDKKSEDTSKDEIKNKLVQAENKAMMLVDLYQYEYKNFLDSFNALKGLNREIFNNIGVDLYMIQKSMQKQMTGLKTKYWTILFEEFDELKEKLTCDTRRKFIQDFRNLLTIDFTIENIWVVVMWVIKNANKHYEDQLISFYKKLSSPENIKQYVSNKRAFETREWGNKRIWSDSSTISHYFLDYRIIMTNIFDYTYMGWRNSDRNTDNRYMSEKERLNDIFVIAQNLGFIVERDCELPKKTGEKYFVYYKNSDKVFMEYRVYKNDNMHVKFDIEFSKAMNVEVARLLGWITKKEDIKKEFDPKMAKGAEKYFKANRFIQLDGNGLKLLGTTKTAEVA